MTSESDDPLGEDATDMHTDVPESQPWLSAEMVPDYDEPYGFEAFQIIHLDESTCSSTWLKRRRKRQRLLKRKRYPRAGGRYVH
jgi:hypothetical protein